jgi:hypothetical protein
MQYAVLKEKKLVHELISVLMTFREQNVSTMQQYIFPDWQGLHCRTQFVWGT